MKNINLIIGFALLMTIISCSSSSTMVVSENVKYDMDKTVDFNQFKSYQLHILNDEQNIAPFLNDINKKRLENAIIGNMGKKGMSLSANPDVILAYGVNIDSKKSFSTFGSMAGGVGVTTSEEFTSYSGKITVALLEYESEKLLWYGSSGKELEGDPKKTERNINKVVAEIFQAFPIDYLQLKDR